MCMYVCVFMHVLVFVCVCAFMDMHMYTCIYMYMSIASKLLFYFLITIDCILCSIVNVYFVVLFI